MVRNELIGRIIMANYGKTRYYKIEDILFDGIEELELDDGTKLLDYYQEKYKITPKNTYFKITSWAAETPGTTANLI